MGQRRNKEQRKAQSKTRKSSANNDEARRPEETSNADIYSKSPAKKSEQAPPLVGIVKKIEVVSSTRKKSQRQSQNQNHPITSPREVQRNKRHHVGTGSSNVSHFQHLIREGRKSIYNNPADASQSEKQSPLKSSKGQLESQRKIEQEQEREPEPVRIVEASDVPKITAD